MAARKRERAEHRFRFVGALRPPTGFEVPVTVSTGPSGPVALWASAADRDDILGRYTRPGGTSSARTRTASHPRVALASYASRSLEPDDVLILSDLPVAHPLVQPLPQGRFLVVGARCAWRATGPEKNALVIGSDGEILRSGTFGDGVQQVLVDDAGEVWIGYFDEGIGGNFGWGEPGPVPLGRAGIVRWSTRFEKLWEYQAVDRYRLDDCYVLNVDRCGAWACPYGDFPVIRIDSGTVIVRPTAGVSGPRGLLVAGSAVAFIGSYESEGSLRIGTLDGLAGLRKSRVALPNGRRAPVGHLTCRGSVADLFVGGDWYTFDLAEAVTGAP